LIDSPQPQAAIMLADVVAIPALGKEPAANTGRSANGDDLRKG